MKIIEAITKIDAIKPNNYTTENKVAWLSTLDGIVKEEIIDTHEGGEAVVFTGYDKNTPNDTELLIPAPYDDVYMHWLGAQIDFANGEYGRYSNSMTMFNTSYDTYERYYNRNHMPLGKKFKFFLKEVRV